MSELTPKMILQMLKLALDEITDFEGIECDDQVMMDLAKWMVEQQLDWKRG